jgi:hypothetical protein
MYIHCVPNPIEISEQLIKYRTGDFWSVKVNGVSRTSTHQKIKDVITDDDGRSRLGCWYDHVHDNVVGRQQSV